MGYERAGSFDCSIFCCCRMYVARMAHVAKMSQSFASFSSSLDVICREAEYFQFRYSLLEFVVDCVSLGHNLQYPNTNDRIIVDSQILKKVEIPSCNGNIKVDSSHYFRTLLRITMSM